MDLRKDIRRLQKRYFRHFPEEKAETGPFTEFVARIDGESLYDRKNLAGHITAGGVIVSRASHRVLLLKHRQLGKWLQPGGHVEAADDSVLDAAYREIAEETGIRSEQLTPLTFPGETALPLDMDSHYIPACAAKNEAEHTHHDMRFVFLFDGDDDRVMIDRNESDAFRWVSLDELAAIPDFRDLAPRIETLLGEADAK